MPKANVIYIQACKPTIVLLTFPISTKQKAIIREKKYCGILLEARILPMPINIPKVKTGSLSIVQEATPKGDIQSNPTMGVQMKPLKKKKDNIIIIVVNGHLFRSQYKIGDIT